MIPPITMDYSTWELDGKVYDEMKLARKDAGISRVDTWSYDKFICGAIVNGLLYTELYHHPLANNSVWEAFKNQNPTAYGESFEDAIEFIATALSQYHCNDDAFYVYRGEEVLAHALETFLTIFPYLKMPAEVSKGYVASRADDYLDSDEDGDESIKRHYLSREIYAVSWSDSAELDDHLASIFSIGFEVLADNTHSHPADIDETEWDYTLRKMAKGFKNYHLNNTPLEKWVKETFVSRFTNFWD